MKKQLSEPNPYKGEPQQEQTADFRSELILERNKFVSELPTGEVQAWDFIQVIQQHIKRLDDLIDKQQQETGKQEQTAVNEGKRNQFALDFLTVLVNERHRVALEKGFQSWNNLLQNLIGIRVDDAESLALNNSLKVFYEAYKQQEQTAEGKQAFETFPKLADHIERMATTGMVGNVSEWSDFLRELNKAIEAYKQQQETGIEQAIKALEEEIGNFSESASYGKGIKKAIEIIQKLTTK